MPTGRYSEAVYEPECWSKQLNGLLNIFNGSNRTLWCIVSMPITTYAQCTREKYTFQDEGLSKVRSSPLRSATRICQLIIRLQVLSRSNFVHIILMTVPLKVIISFGHKWRRLQVWIKFSCSKMYLMKHFMGAMEVQSSLKFVHK